MQKFLVIRFSSIGDVVLTSPVVRLLRQRFPDATIHFLIKSAFVPVVQHNPAIDKVIVYQKGELSTLLPELKEERYSQIIDLQGSLRSNKIKRYLHVPSKTFNKLNIEKWLLVNFKINRLPALHIVERYIATIRTFDIENDHQGLDYFITAEEQEEWREQGIHLPEKFVAFAVGAAHKTKQIPTSLFIEMAEALPVPVVLLGGDNDTPVAEKICAAVKSCINLCGKLSINGSAAVVQKAAVVLTGDTGLMHIAAAMQRPIVSVWGNTVPAFGMTPYQPQHPENCVIIERTDVACRPCSKIGYKKCPKGHFRCMEAQDSAQIRKSLLHFL